MYRLSDAHGVGLLSFVVCSPRTMKEYCDIVVKLFVRGERSDDSEIASSHQGGEGAGSSKNESHDPEDRW